MLYLMRGVFCTIGLTLIRLNELCFGNKIVVICLSLRGVFCAIGLTLIRLNELWFGNKIVVICLSLRGVSAFGGWGGWLTNVGGGGERVGEATMAFL